MTRMISLFRLLGMTAIGLLTTLLLSTPVRAEGELPVVNPMDNPASLAKAVVQFRAFNAPGGEDVYFGKGALPNDSMGVHDWVNEAAWAERNPFTITYSAASGELAVSITVQTLRDVEMYGPTRTYSGVRQVGSLGALDYVAWTVSNQAKQVQVTSATVGVENVVFNGARLGNYMVGEGAQPGVWTFSLEPGDFTAGFVLTGEIVQSGKHSGRPDDNRVEFVVGIADASDVMIVDDTLDGIVGDGDQTGDTGGNAGDDSGNSAGGSQDDGTGDTGEPVGDPTDDGSGAGDPHHGDNHSDTGDGSNPGGNTGDTGDTGGDTGGSVGDGQVDPEPTPVEQEPTLPPTEPTDDQVVIVPVDGEPQAGTPQMGSFTVYLPATMQMAAIR